MMKVKSSTKTTFYIVRHGHTRWNKLHLMQGHGDSPLTTDGIKQAKQMAQKLKRIHFDEVFSSDLLRAKKTAEIIALEKKIAVKTSQALRERNFGEYEGQPFAQYHKALEKLVLRYEIKTQMQKENLHVGSCETIYETVTRFITFLRELAISFPGKKVLVVSHGGVMRYFLIRLAFGTDTTLPPGSISNMALIKLTCDGVDFFIKKTEGITLSKVE